MTIFNPTFSRRAFLGSVTASVVITVAGKAAGALLSLGPLAVNAVIHRTDALDGLHAVLSSPYFDLRAILLPPTHDAETSRSDWEENSKKVGSAVRGLLARNCSKVPMFEIHPKGPREDSFDWELGLPTLLLGSFSGLWATAEARNPISLPPVVTRLLRASPTVYVDDPLLAARIAAAPELAELAPRTMGGLCCSVDPAVDFALSHLRSGAMGPITHIFTSLRVRDAANLLEAKAIHKRLLAGSSPSSFPSLRLTGVASVHPSITLRGALGQLQVALYTAIDRHVMLPARLQYFALAARGNAESQLFDSYPLRLVP